MHLWHKACHLRWGHPTEFDLHHSLESLREMFTLRAEKKSLTLTFEGIDALPHYLHTDELKLRQVLINLVSNAIKFTDRGRVTLRTRYDDQTQRLHVDVEDTGVGIAEDELDQVFEAFVQTASGRKSHRKKGG